MPHLDVSEFLVFQSVLYRVTLIASLAQLSNGTWTPFNPETVRLMVCAVRSLAGFV